MMPTAFEFPGGARSVTWPCELAEMMHTCVENSEGLSGLVPSRRGHWRGHLPVIAPHGRDSTMKVLRNLVPVPFAWIRSTTDIA